MDTSVLREPRGFMRCVEFLFALLALVFLRNFSTHMTVDITCSDGKKKSFDYSVDYPFVPGMRQVNVSCGSSSSALSAPGDFSSDASFYSFLASISLMASMLLILVYVFASKMYSNPNKKPPLADFCFTIIIAVLWLAATALWANGLGALKSILQGQWLFEQDDSLCKVEEASQSLTNTDVDKCEVVFTGSFSGANIAVLLGLLNTFLWGSNLWFLYKETVWFAGLGPIPQEMT